MASESDDQGSVARSGTMNGSNPPSEHHDLESVSEASDLDHHHGHSTPPPPPARPHHVDPSPAPDEEDEDGGGPVKTFIEHLEDLRWMLIKAGASVLIGMVVCLVAAPFLIDVLKAPLRKADLLRETKEAIVVLRMGTNTLWRLPRSDFPGLPAAPEGKHVESYQLIPTPDGIGGTNFVLSLQADASEAAEAEPSTALKNLGPMEPFTVALQIALYGGLGLALPFVLYFIGEFVVPALKRKEKRLVFRGLGIGSVLFLLGVVFCYFVVVQMALNFAVNVSRWMHFGADTWRAPEYLSFVMKLLLAMGLAFELPVVLLTLVAIDLLDYQKLTKFRIYWVVINLVLCAMITPDPLSMILMALPLQALYEISVMISWIWGRRRREDVVEA
jgi:sec-independent protein translocase protein TatC